MIAPPPLADLPVSRECYRCGYDLTTIADSQACPECGLLAERSRRVSDELHNTRPTWLRKLSLGTKLLLLTILVPILWLIALGIIDAFLADRYSALPAWWWTSVFGRYFAPFLGIDLAGFCFVVGIWLLTSPEGYPPADGADRRRRIALRVVSWFPLIALAAFQYQQGRLQVTYRRDWPFQLLELIGVVCLGIGCIPLPLLLFRQLRSLAKRARSAHVAEHCTIVGFGASYSIVYFSLHYALWENAEKLGLGNYWTTRSDASLVITLVLALLASLFLLWSLYVLIRFTISFHIAAKKLRAQWKRDDRALEPTSA